MSRSIDQRTVALLGGPESGKTTFLAALVDAIQQGPQRCSLEFEDEGEDVSPHRKLTEPLLLAKYPQRTKGERLHIDLGLSTRLSPDKSPIHFRLRIGDYNGEELERLFRRLSVENLEEWEQRANAQGLLLFLRPDAIYPLVVKRKAAPAGEQPAGPRGPVLTPADMGIGSVVDEVPEARKLTAADPVRVPTVLALVELIQYLRRLRQLLPGERPRRGSFRIAIVLSAWDAVPATWRQQRPVAYLMEHASLLVDFLASNYHLDDVFYFGVSSTGGDLAVASHAKRYRDDPGGYVHYANHAGRVIESPDLALPIRFVLFGDEAIVRGT